jgi:hypothetical protein
MKVGQSVFTYNKLKASNPANPTKDKDFADEVIVTPSS